MKPAGFPQTPIPGRFPPAIFKVNGPETVEVRRGLYRIVAIDIPGRHAYSLLRDSSCNCTMSIEVLFIVSAGIAHILSWIQGDHGPRGIGMFKGIVDFLFASERRPIVPSTDSLQIIISPFLSGKPGSYLQRSKSRYLLTMMSPQTLLSRTMSAGDFPSKPEFGVVIHR